MPSILQSWKRFHTPGRVLTVAMLAMATMLAPKAGALACAGITDGIAQHISLMREFNMSGNAWMGLAVAVGGASLLACGTFITGGS